MSEQDKAESTDFSDAWEESGAKPGQPDQGRSEEDDALAGEGEAGGADEDAAGPASEAQATDADKDPPAGDENSDEFASLSAEELRQRLLDEREARTRAENTLRSNEGRFSRAMREASEYRRRLEELEQRQEQPGTPAKEKVDVDAVLNKVEEDYPELGGDIKTVISTLRSEVEELRHDSSRRAELDKAEAELAEQEFFAGEMQKLAGAHTDWEVVVKMPEYAAWANTQDEWIKDIIRKNGKQLVDGSGAAFVIGEFKKTLQTGKTDPALERRERQLRGSEHIESRRPGMEPRGRGGGDYDSEWDLAVEEDQRKATRRR